MRSIKPGRGPSMMSGISAVFAALFGVYWTVMASRASGAFALFGVFFVMVAVVQAVYNFKNATGKNRYSAFDITENGVEADPLNERFGEVNNVRASGAKFCPYCGAPAKEDANFCCKCGAKLI